MMKSLRWMVLGTPLLALGGWASEGRAAEFSISFDVAALDPLPPTDGARAEVNPDFDNHDPDAHLLSFTPPQTASEQPPAVVLPSSETAAIAPARVAPTSVDSPPSALPLPSEAAPQSSAAAEPLPLPPTAPEIAALFADDENSVVAIAVGYAEGTRTVKGERTLAYYGHVDPGNQAWNQGTFSYQHAARSPAEADQKQLERLQQQAKALHNLAFQSGISLTNAELLNGIDLANQAPAAALDRGYINWLAEAKTMGLQGDEAILWARTRSFLDPDSGHWNAPGLGNSVQTITHDQARRQQAIAQAMALHIPANAAVETGKGHQSHAQPVAVDDATIDPILRMDHAL